MKTKLKRFFVPDVNSWKYCKTIEKGDSNKSKSSKLKNREVTLTQTANYIDEDLLKNNEDVMFKLDKPSVMGQSKQEMQDEMIENSVHWYNWNFSFTKKCISISFLIFIIANIFIIIGLTASFIIQKDLEHIETYVTEVYSLMKDVIGVYIIKAGVENLAKIIMSVVSDYFDKKYDSNSGDEIEFEDDPMFSPEEKPDDELVSD